MLCPYCLNEDSKVMDKRDAGGFIKRRRECLKCEMRFNTTENVERVELRVVKKDGKKQDFDREKLRKGITRACEKRPVKDEEIEKMIIKVEEKLRKKGNDVKTEFIGEQISNELKKMDKVAYIRFASVYKDFSEIDDFKHAIASLSPRESGKLKDSRRNKREIKELVKA
jgi:transcriptional repressor NrdR